jgi:hypothetical protein
MVLRDLLRGEFAMNRFSPWVEESGSGARAIMRADAAGEWVKYADYLTMEGRVAVMESTIALIGETVKVPAEPKP